MNRVEKKSSAIYYQKISNFKFLIFYLNLILLTACGTQQTYPQIITTAGYEHVEKHKVWLTHEHILVDFIGADSINPSNWNHNKVIKTLEPYLNAIKTHNVDYFVDCTPNYIGRDVTLLDKIAKKFNIKILTNTGLYGARGKKFIPEFAKKATAKALADIWIDEFKFGINHTEIKPGFIKIGIDNADSLHTIDYKLVEAACIAHRETGLTIASHTGAAAGMWAQLKVLKKKGVSPNAFIWVHAQFEQDNQHYLKAAKAGCWISLDGLAWDIDNHIAKLVFAKEHNILDRILISHDAGWFDPQKDVQDIKPYTNLFEVVIPKLYENGFTQEDIDVLIKKNPVEAYSINKRLVK